MLELVFSDSACGSLKVAQNYGEGEYCGAAGFFVITDDGSTPCEKELEAFRLEYEEKERLKWEKATPMGGNSADVYGFSLALSIGDISESMPDIKRQKILEWLYSIYPDIVDEEEIVKSLQVHVADTLSEIFGRMAAGEDIRIWYSNNSDEMCGLYWFMSLLSKQDNISGQIYLIKLPDWNTGEDNAFEQKIACGEIDSGEWMQFVPLQKAMPDGFVHACSSRWEELQKENYPLRVVLNGQLVSVPESFYDDFIVREIKKENTVFDEVMIIGRVLGDYKLGIGDSWVAHRIGSMIDAGKLESVTEAAKDLPVYHRKLKKLF